MIKLKLTEVQLFSFFFIFKCVAANASKLFCMGHLATNGYFLDNFKLSFYVQNFIRMHTHQAQLMKINSNVRRY